MHCAVHSQAAQAAASPEQAAHSSALVSWDTFKSLAKPGDRLRLTGDASPVPGATSCGPRDSLSASPDRHPNPDAALSAAQGVVMPAGSTPPLDSDADVAIWAASSAHRDSDPALGLGTTAAADGAVDRASTAQQQMWRATPPAASSQADKLMMLAEVRVQDALLPNQAQPA